MEVVLKYLFVVFVIRSNLNFHCRYTWDAFENAGVCPKPLALYDTSLLVHFVDAEVESHQVVPEPIDLRLKSFFDVKGDTGGTRVLH